MIRECLLPLAIVAAVATMLIPLPPFLLDILLASNLVLALSLLVLSLYISEPLKLSSLPSVLLLATLYRLALNIATTRLILSTGNAGATVEAFGTFVIRGNPAAGIVIFLIITLVQFLVVAKGAERVAEVSARFSLDALPGRQMSIDADVRAGVYDFETARRKRQELQTESRFYGALDGSMKFIKGDAIAGVVVVFVNMTGGLLSGLLMHGLDLHSAFAQYATLTIGDGLLSQIPSLLNAVAAGLVVTRVTRGDGVSLSRELFSQLGQHGAVHVLCGSVAILAGIAPGLPFFPFFLTGLFLFIKGASGRNGVDTGKNLQFQKFRPRVPPVIRVELDNRLVHTLIPVNRTESALEDLRKRVFDSYGLLLMPPELSPSGREGNSFSIHLRGVCLCRSELSENDGLSEILGELERTVGTRVSELVDDISTRRLLDYLDSDFPELISAVIPSIITVTRLTELLRKLSEEGIPFRNLDIILQAVSESAPRVTDDRVLLAEVRIALRRIICARFMEEGRIRAFTLAPLLDMTFAKAEAERRPVDLEHVRLIGDRLVEAGGMPVLVVSRQSRMLIRECLLLQGVNPAVLAFEELIPDIPLDITECISTDDRRKDESLFAALAA